MWHKYKNGNFYVYINDEDGSKIRATIDENEEEFIPEFAESIDFKITNRCDVGCKFCHEKSDAAGDEGKIEDWKFLETLHPYTEIAIGGGNALCYSHLYELLELLKSKNVYANITIHESSLFNPKLDYIIENNLVKGIGVSLYNINENVLSRIKSIPNSVIHLINGVSATKKFLDELSDKDLKILILGYKAFGRGAEYLIKTPQTNKNMNWLRENCSFYINKFNVVSFDNLAVQQLKVNEIIPREKWSMFYSGDDGSHTFYIDGVNKQFAKSSTSPVICRYPLTDNVDDMFKVIQIFKKF